MRREYYFYTFVTGACVQLIAVGNILFHNILGSVDTSNDSFAISLFLLTLATPFSLLLLNLGNIGLKVFPVKALNAYTLLFTIISVGIGLVI